MPLALLYIPVELLTVYCTLEIVFFGCISLSFIIMQLLGLLAYFHLIFNLHAIGITIAIALIKTALFEVELRGKCLVSPLTLSSS